MSYLRMGTLSAYVSQPANAVYVMDLECSQSRQVDERHLDSEPSSTVMEGLPV